MTNEQRSDYLNSSKDALVIVIDALEQQISAEYQKGFTDGVTKQNVNYRAIAESEFELRGKVAALLRARLDQEKERDEWCHFITVVISAANGWCSEFNMYRNAWLREMGGEIRRKSHEIDGFVLRTRDIYEGYKQVPELKARIADLERQLAALPEEGKP